MPVHMCKYVDQIRLSRQAVIKCRIRGEVQKQGFQCPSKNDLCPPKIKINKKTFNISLTRSEQNFTTEEFKICINLITNFCTRGVNQFIDVNTVSQ